MEVGCIAVGRLQRPDGLLMRLLCELASPLQPIKADIGQFAMSLVAAARFSELLVGARDIEDVIDDLKEHAELGGKEPVGAGLLSGFALQHQDDADAGTDQPPRLEGVQEAQALPALLGLGDVYVLSADHAVDPGRAGQFGERGEDTLRVAWLGCEESNRLGEEAIAGED